LINKELENLKPFSRSLYRDVKRLQGLSISSCDGATLGKDGESYRGQWLSVALMSKNLYGIGFNFKDVYQSVTPLLRQFKSPHVYAGLFKFKDKLQYSAEISVIVHPDYRAAVLEVAGWLRQESVYDFQARDCIYTGHDGNHPRDISVKEAKLIIDSLTIGRVPSIVSVRDEAECLICNSHEECLLTMA
jgi:hypothetical protein